MGGEMDVQKVHSGPPCILHTVHGDAYGVVRLDHYIYVGPLAG
jgi:hypothetical protein